jgi:plastocyanin
VSQEIGARLGVEANDVDGRRMAATARAGVTWRRLLYGTTALEAGLLVVLVAVQQDLLALALLLIIGLGMGVWLGRVRLGASRLPLRHWLGSGWPGLLVLGLVFADIAAYTLTGALSNIVSGETFMDYALPAALAVLSLLGVVAALMVGIRRSEPVAGTRGAVWTAVAGLAAFAGLVGAGMLARPAAPPAPAPSALALETVNMAYSQTELTAAAGEVTLRLSNSDLFWHTFTVDALGANVQAPVGGERLVTFTAAPGAYAFYCAIPGHALIGMRGTLTVE